MSEQPQEWTKREHTIGWIIVAGDREIARFIKQSCPENEIDKLIDAHNAALAAEKMGWKLRISELEDQLAAERERHDRAQERANKWFDLLAAEREKKK